MKYKEGQQLKIISNVHGHRFNIGEVVTVLYVTDSDYRCENQSGYKWWVTEDEVEAHIGNPQSNY